MAQATELAALKDSYAQLLGVCDRLETIADHLPSMVPPAECGRVADAVVDVVRMCHSLEDRVLLPMLLASDRAEIHLAAERLRQEHVFDHQAAHEIKEALEDLVAGRSALSPDATGYMFRSFFESVRRHVHAELDIIALMSDAAAHKDTLQ